MTVLSVDYSAAEYMRGSLPYGNMQEAAAAKKLYLESGSWHEYACVRSIDATDRFNIPRDKTTLSASCVRAEEFSSCFLDS